MRRQNGGDLRGLAMIPPRSTGRARPAANRRCCPACSPKPPPPTPCPPNLKFCGDPDGATGECCTATQTCVTSLGIAQPILRCCPTSQRSGFECVGLDGESSWCCGNEECVTSSDGLSKRCRLKRPSPPRPRRPPPPPRTPTW